MSIDVLKIKLKENNINGAFLFCGDDEYTKDYYSTQIKKLTTAVLPEFNHIILDAKNDSVNELSATFNTFPFMSENKLIELKKLDIPKLSEKEAIEYAEVISSIPEYCTLLMLYRIGELEYKQTSGKSKNKGISDLFSAIKKNGIIVEFKTPETSKLLSWVIRHFKNEGIFIDNNIANYLIEYCGSDLYTLSGEIDKLCNYCENKSVSKKDIELVCCPNVTYQAFDLTRAMIEKDYNKALKIFGNLQLYKTEPTIILGTISKLLSDMLIIKAGMDCNISTKNIAYKSGISEWIIKKYTAFLQNQTNDFLRFASGVCLEADSKMKSSGQETYSILEMLIIRISTYE
ncbi:MAG: DNA polymerase III subunit delta [Clostridiales bacterium GWF2_38_85]|nr:MAG: DNA polymerase III subunit delta [Clostridiales bacterium GWF2_38_85]